LITSTLGKVIRLQCGLLTYPCGVLSMWAYVLWAFVLWAFVRVGFCLDTGQRAQVRRHAVPDAAPPESVITQNDERRARFRA